MECRMRHHFVMRGDVKPDEATKGGGAVQRMEVEPGVFQRSPECLDHRIREAHLDLSKNACPFLVIQQIINCSVHVLASRIRNHDRLLGTIFQPNDRFT
jgi:hypothetical protein